MSANSHRIQSIERFPAKPRTDGRFQKRIHGRLYYFGANGDRVAALAEYDRVKHRLYAGIPVVVAPVGELNAGSIKELANRFLFDKQGEIAAKTYSEYKASLRRFARFFGVRSPWRMLCPDEFTRYAKHLRGRLGSYAYNRERAAILAMFSWASAQDWIDKPPKIGKGFQKASLAELRANRPDTILGCDEISALLGVCSRQLFAMILLAINGGYGPADLRLLEWRMIDLDGAIISDRRAKTAIKRTVPLWPETVFALKRARREGDNLVFRTRHGNQWAAGEIAHQFRVVATRAGLELPPRAGMYALRHTFATIANEVRDTDARRHLMGHRLHGLDDNYVLTIFQPRLQAVTDHVRARLQIPAMIGVADVKERR